MTTPMALAYEERGSGPLLLFIHGFPLDRRMWIPQLSGLAKIRTCVAVDLRGHGLSEDPDPKDYSMDLFADDVAATLDELGAEQADICALSMGGYVAFALWRRHKARIRSLTLIDTKAEADTEEGKKGREGAAASILADGMEAFHAVLDPKMFGPSPDPAAREAVRQMMLDVPPATAAADALAMRDRPDSTPDLGGIDVPVLWCHGADDILMPVAGARDTAGKIPGARFVEIENAGHMANMENPHAVNAAMKEFLTA
jgi:3-oxoadipate enol-lactonase